MGPARARDRVHSDRGFGPERSPLALSLDPPGPRRSPRVSDPDPQRLRPRLEPGLESREPADVLASLDSRTFSADTLVVSLSARACRDPSDPKTLWIIPGNPSDGLDRKLGWVMLGDVLKKVASHPARNKLLILDLHPLPSDPRLGLLEADVGTEVREAVLRDPATKWLVLTSASAGEVPATSEAIGRSIFSLYLEEGLRGWADVAEPGSSPDGRVTAKELATYVRERVGRWVRRNRGKRRRLLSCEATPRIFRW